MQSGDSGEVSHRVACSTLDAAREKNDTCWSREAARNVLLQLPRNKTLHEDIQQEKIGCVDSSIFAPVRPKPYNLLLRVLL